MHGGWDFLCGERHEQWRHLRDLRWRRCGLLRGRHVHRCGCLVQHLDHGRQPDPDLRDLWGAMGILLWSANATSGRCHSSRPGSSSLATYCCKSLGLPW